jgi:hypothetical protein
MDWMSVKDELPQDDEFVLCYSNKNGGYFFIGYYRKDLDVWCKDGLMHCYDVLYWCPLEAPKGV